MEQFKKTLEERPFEFIKLTTIRAVKYFSPIRPLGFWFYQHGWKQFVFISCSALASFLLFLFGFAGIISSFFKEKRNHLLFYFLSFVFLTFASIVPIIVETRYRLPIYPFMAVFAGFFISRFISFKIEYFNYLIYSFIFLMALLFVDLSLEYKKILEKIDVIFKYGK